MKKPIFLLSIVIFLISCNKDAYPKNINKVNNKAGIKYEIPNVKEVAQYRLSYFKSTFCQPNCPPQYHFGGQIYKSRAERPLLKNVGELRVDGTSILMSERNYYAADDSTWTNALWEKKTFNLSVPSLGINEQVTVGERLEDIQVLNGTIVKWTPSATEDYNIIYIEGSFNNFPSVMNVVEDNGTFDIAPYIKNVKKGTNMEIRMRRGNHKVFKDNKGKYHLFFWSSGIITNFVVQ